MLTSETPNRVPAKYTLMCLDYVMSCGMNLRIEAHNGFGHVDSNDKHTRTLMPDVCVCVCVRVCTE